MKWRAYREPYDKCAWRRWFAWYPVNIGAYWHWLEHVDRRAYMDTSIPPDMQTGFEYKVIVYDPN